MSVTDGDLEAAAQPVRTPPSTGPRLLRGSAAAFAIALVLLHLGEAPAEERESKGYVGAPACATCHRELFERWAETGHARIMVRPGAAEARDIPLPLGIERSEVYRVIGGFRWKALFLDREGYLLTADGGGPGRTQFNLAGRRWMDFRPGERVPYDCGPCHTTGYEPEGRQEGLPGISGTWALDGVQCESCHGPGASHARTGSAADIRDGGQGCGTCHGRPSPHGIPLEGVFLAPYTEVDQLRLGAMGGLACTVCHDPHRSGAAGLRKACESCHERVALEYRGSLMSKARVRCVDCHMPPAGIVAQGDPESVRGDLRSHLFRIDHHLVFPKRVVDGRNFNPGALGIGQVCTQCHDTHESRQWALAYGPLVHRLKVTPNTRIVRFQMAFAWAGMALALLALLSAAALRGWIRSALSRERLASVHRHAAWSTFAIFFFETSLCLYVHTPDRSLSALAQLGWFALHPATGAAGAALYAFKVLAVRRLGLGWRPTGTVLGIGLFLFWTLQLATVLVSGAGMAHP